MLSTGLQNEIDSTVEQDPMRVSSLDRGKETNQTIQGGKANINVSSEDD